MENISFVTERTYNAPVERVWKALTDAGQMRQWYFDLKEFRAEPGFEFSFEGGTEEKKYQHLCRITEVIPNKKLVHTWTYPGYPGHSVVTWELFDENGKTRLKLTHAGLESFAAANDPNIVPENFAEGWTYITGTSLKNFVETDGQDG